MKLSFKPNKRTRLREHGFRSRMATKGGQKVLARRRAKGRVSLTVSEAAKKYISARISTKRARRVKGTGPANSNRTIVKTTVKAPAKPATKAVAKAPVKAKVKKTAPK